MPHSQPTEPQQTVCKFHLDPQYHIFHWGSIALGDSTLCKYAHIHSTLYRWMASCKNYATPLLTHWSCVSFAFKPPTHVCHRDRKYGRYFREIPSSWMHESLPIRWYSHVLIKIYRLDVRCTCLCDTWVLAKILHLFENPGYRYRLPGDKDPW